MIPSAASTRSKTRHLLPCRQGLWRAAVDGDQEPPEEGKWQAHQVIGERQTESVLEYKVTVQRTVWLPKKHLASKLVRRFEAEQPARSSVQRRDEKVVSIKAPESWPGLDPSSPPNSSMALRSLHAIGLSIKAWAQFTMTETAGSRPGQDILAAAGLLFYQGLDDWT